MAAIARSPHPQENRVFATAHVLQTKAAEKREFVQKFIRSLERAERQNAATDRAWLRDVVNPQDLCFQTLVKLLLAKKYEGFVSLHCVCLRAMQMMLRIAVNMVATGGRPYDVPHAGLHCFTALAGAALAEECYPRICRMAEYQVETLLACNAILVLAELGPQALRLHHSEKLLDLFVSVPERADELVEVALRMHSWGGEQRTALLQGLVSHDGGNLVGEVLLQVVNRGDEGRKSRALKILTGCLDLPGGSCLLYTNDALVLIEILLRELPCVAEDPASFEVHAKCLLAITRSSCAARVHRHDEMVQMLGDVREDQRNPLDVRQTCARLVELL